MFDLGTGPIIQGKLLCMQINYDDISLELAN